jgi:hypothetical protein
MRRSLTAYDSPMRTAVAAICLAAVSALMLWLTISLWINGSIFFAILVGSVGVALLWALIDNVLVYPSRAKDGAVTDEPEA